VAARKTRQPPQREADSSNSVTAPAENGVETGVPVPLRTTRFWLALGCFAIWFVGLSLLALRTANPVTLNRRQILDADLIVEARVDNVAAGECHVTRVWPEALLGETIIIFGLSDLSVHAGATYLFPLRRDEGGAAYSVMPTPPPDTQILVYPANDEARQQLETILQEQ
jgi:hypothetical protein